MACIPPATRDEGVQTSFKVSQLPLVRRGGAPTRTIPEVAEVEVGEVALRAMRAVDLRETATDSAVAVVAAGLPATGAEDDTKLAI